MSTNDVPSWASTLTPRTGLPGVSSRPTDRIRLEAERNQMATFTVNVGGVRMRAQPDTSATIVIDNLGAGTTVTTVSDQVVTAEGHDWRNVQTSDGQAGWVASEFLDAVQTTERFSVT